MPPRAPQIQRMSAARSRPMSNMRADACAIVMRDEAPIASHLLFTQPGILDDHVPAERTLGIDAGHAWLIHADAVVFYIDRGMSHGMQVAMRRAQRAGVDTELRSIEPVAVGAT